MVNSTLYHLLRCDIIILDKIINCNLPSTSDVSKVTFAALRLPAGKLRPIFSNFSRNKRPPFFDFALNKYKHEKNEIKKIFRHSKCTKSETVSVSIEQ